MALAMLVVGLVVGFLLGTRAKQMVAMFRTIIDGAWRSVLSLRLPAEAGADDEDGDVEAALRAPGDDANAPSIDNFLSDQTSADLDENAGLVVNPVLMYIVREAKAERARLDKLQRAQERRMGLSGSGEPTDDELSELNALYSQGGEEPRRKRAINVLIENGARLSSVANVADAEKVAAQMGKRNAANIFHYFSKTHDIDVRSREAARRRSDIGRWMPTAIEKANETEHTRYLSEDFKRQTVGVRAARNARTELRLFGDGPEYKAFRQAQIERARDSKREEEALFGTSKGKAVEQISAEFAVARPDDGQVSTRDAASDSYDEEDSQRSVTFGGEFTLGEVRKLADELGEDDLLTTERRERAEFGSSRSVPPSQRDSYKKRALQWKAKALAKE